MVTTLQRLLLFSWCLLGAAALGKPSSGWTRNGYSWGKGHSNWSRDQSYWPNSGPKEVLVKVEVERDSSKKKKKSKKRRHSSHDSSSSEHDSSSSSDAKRSHQKETRKKNRKDRRSQGSSRLAPSEMEELQEFRRQAEIKKVAEEVKATLNESGSPDGGKVPGKGIGAIPKHLTPKSKNGIAAEARIFKQDGVHSLISDVSTWDDVHGQLTGNPLPDLKALHKQLCDGD
ncbi:unnamed protein product, partial [Symbiodinium sp. CCMP2456]